MKKKKKRILKEEIKEVNRDVNDDIKEINRDINDDINEVNRDINEVKDVNLCIKKISLVSKLAGLNSSSSVKFETG